MSSQFNVRGKVITPFRGQIVDDFPSGLYNIGYNDQGIYAQRLKAKNRNLLSFPDSITTDIIEETKQFLTLRDEYKRRKESHKRGFLIYGVPGTGKTAISALLTQYYLENNGIVINWNSLVPDFVPLLKNRNVLILADELDQHMRGGDLHALLTFLDGVVQVENTVIVGMTNYIDRIPAAVQRPSRFDQIIEMGMPTFEQRLMYIEAKAESPQAVRVQMAQDSEGLSIADIKELILAYELYGHPYQTTLKRLGSSKCQSENCTLQGPTAAISLD